MSLESQLEREDQSLEDDLTDNSRAFPKMRLWSVSVPVPREGFPILRWFENEADAWDYSIDYESVLYVGNDSSKRGWVDGHSNVHKHEFNYSREGIVEFMNIVAKHNVVNFKP